MVVVLSIIAMVSAGVLSLVYGPTSAKIEENAARALEGSVYEVLPGISKINIVRANPDQLGVDDPQEMREMEQITTLIYQGEDEAGQVIGYAFVGEANGYGGVVKVLVGVDEESDQILAVKVLEHTETPGLGSKVEDASFRNQFVGKTVQDAIQLGQDIDNISGATVSAEAVVRAVRRGFDDANLAYKGGN